MEYDPIPEDPAAFAQWVDDNPSLMITRLASGRRGWSTALGQYIRGMNVVIYIDGAPVDFGRLEDLLVFPQGGVRVLSRRLP